MSPCLIFHSLSLTPCTPTLDSCFNWSYLLHFLFHFQLSICHLQQLKPSLSFFVIITMSGLLAYTLTAVTIEKSRNIFMCLFPVTLLGLCWKYFSPANSPHPLAERPGHKALSLPYFLLISGQLKTSACNTSNYFWSSHSFYSLDLHLFYPLQYGSVFALTYRMQIACPVNPYC